MASVGRIRTRLYNRPATAAIDSKARCERASGLRPRRSWRRRFIRARAAAPLDAAEAAPLVVAGRIETPVHPAAAGYLKKLLDEANADGAALVVLTLSTPGGLLASTREMSSAILASKTPVATYVAPAGAQAASAGFFLLLAGDVAAMAPGTNTGAAHPVGGEGQDLPRRARARRPSRTRARSCGRSPASGAATWPRPRPRSRTAFRTRRRKRRSRA